MTSPTSHSKYFIPELLKHGKQCIIITDLDTAETLSQKVTRDVGYIIDMRTKDFVRIEDILNQTTEIEQPKEEEKKKHKIF